MRRSYLRRSSSKNDDRRAKAKPVREAMIAKAGRCMICGARPGARNGRMPELNRLCVHEIANGPLRQKALDKPFACLVLCWHCNGTAVENKAEWPVARQLALLKERSPEDYDLMAFNLLVNERAPNRWAPEDVAAHRESLPI